MIRLTVEGRAFYVRPEHVVAVGTGHQDVENPDFHPGRPIDNSNPPMMKVPVTMVTVAFAGPIPVEESVERVLSVVGTSVPVGPRVDWR